LIEVAERIARATLSQLYIHVLSILSRGVIVHEYGDETRIVVPEEPAGELAQLSAEERNEAIENLLQPVAVGNVGVVELADAGIPDDGDVIAGPLT
jgi:hypothetical protein